MLDELSSDRTLSTEDRSEKVSWHVQEEHIVPRCRGGQVVLILGFQCARSNLGVSRLLLIRDCDGLSMWLVCASTMFVQTVFPHCQVGGARMLGMLRSPLPMKWPVLKYIIPKYWGKQHGCVSNCSCSRCRLFRKRNLKSWQ